MRQAANNNNIMQAEESTLKIAIMSTLHNEEHAVAMDAIKRMSKLIQVDMLHRGSLTTKVARMSAQQMMAITTVNTRPMQEMLTTMAKKSNQSVRRLLLLHRKQKRASTNRRKRLKRKM